MLIEVWVQAKPPETHDSSAPLQGHLDSDPPNPDFPAPGDPLREQATAVRDALGEAFLGVTADADSWLIGLAVDADELKEAGERGSLLAQAAATLAGLPAWDIAEVSCWGPETERRRVSQHTHGWMTFRLPDEDPDA